MYEALLAQLDRLCSGRNYTPLFFPQGELLPVEKLNGRGPAVCRPSRRQAGSMPKRNALGADACRVQRPMVDPRVYEILARAQWRGGAERNKQP